MSAPTQLVSTQDLALGMYVARLDRPWLETPFLFQGFTIKSQAEIDELRRFCQHVHVEVNGSLDHAPSRTVGAWRRPPKSAGRLRRAFRWLKRARAPGEAPPGDFYANTVNAEVELPRAKQIYTQASGVFGEMMEKVRFGGKLDTQTLDSVVSPMMESLLRNSDAMTWLSRMKQTDDYTYGHSVSCAIYAIAFGRHLGLPKEDLRVLGLGGLLLDVGKTRIPTDLLAKQGKLTEAEMQTMRQHVRYGEEIVNEAGGVEARVLAMVRSHHERYDGSGYPDGLKGPDIPVFARIGGIVDFYDAMITPRAYAPAVSGFDAMRQLHKRAGKEFQSEMVEQFIQAVGAFPNGALVELSSGEVGVVVEQNRVRRLRPKVMVILGVDKKPLAEPKALELRDLPAEPGEKNAVWIDRGLEIGAYGIDPADYYL